MRIPFTAPQIPELDALPVEQRALVLRSYARSTAARRCVRFFQASILVAAVLFCIALTSHGATRAACMLAVALSLVGGVVCYRVAATRAIRVILRNGDSDLGEHGGTPKA
jgi:hypothetical protein